MRGLTPEEKDVSVSWWMALAAGEGARGSALHLKNEWEEGTCRGLVANAKGGSPSRPSRQERRDRGWQPCNLTPKAHPYGSVPGRPSASV